MDDQAINDALVAANKVYVAWDTVSFSNKMDEAGDWRSDVVSKLSDGDIKGMAEAAGPRMQGVLIEVAADPKVPPQTRIAAATNILGQIGHGEVKQVQHNVVYDSMETDQLAAITRSKLARIASVDPSFDVSKLLPEGTIEAEFSEVTVQQPTETSGE